MGCVLVVSSAHERIGVQEFLSALGNVPGFDIIVPWDDFSPEEMDQKEGAFLYLDNYDSRVGPDSLRPWFLQIVEAASSAPVLRSWSILVVSPLAQHRVECLRDERGIDLREEHALVLIYPFDGIDRRRLRKDDECQAICASVTEALQRILLSKTQSRVGLDPVAVRARANLLQAQSILAVRGSKLHTDHHAFRNAEGMQAREVEDHCSAVLAGIAEDLQPFVSNEPLVEFAEHGKRLLRNAPDAEGMLLGLARYVEESGAALALRSSMPLGDLEHGLEVVLVDDDGEFLETMSETLGKSIPATVHLLHVTPEMRQEAYRRSETDGAGFSEILADAVHDIVRHYVDERAIIQKWRRGRTRFVVVVDIRLDPRAPDSGMRLIRRVHDDFPFANIMALTVRTGLVQDLADEGVTAYLVKSRDAKDVAHRLRQAIFDNVLQAESFACYGDTELVTRDEFLSYVLKRKHQLVSATSREGASVRVVLCNAESLDVALQETGPGACVCIVIDCGTDPGVALCLMRKCRREWRRECVILWRLNHQDDTAVLLPSSVLYLDRTLHSGLIAKHDMRWELLVPRTAHCGSLNVVVSKEQRASFRAMVAERFGGATTSESKGVWLRPTDRREIQDDHERVEIWARDTEANRRYVLGVAEEVARSLGQEEVFLQEESISNWSLGTQFAELMPEGTADAEGRVLVPFAFGAPFL